MAGTKPWNVATAVLVVLLVIVASTHKGAIADDSGGNTPLEFHGASNADESCCECCDPLWTFRGGVLFLNLSRPDQRELVRCDGNMLDGRDFVFNTQPGWEVGVMRQLGCNWKVEGLYYSLNGWTSTRGPIDSPDGAFVQYINEVGTPDHSTIFGRYFSELQDVEINFRYTIRPRTDLLLGVRYMDVGERLFIRNVNLINGDVFEHTITAGNQLVGPQIGLDTEFWSRDRFGLFGTIKAGILGSEARNSADILVSGVPGGHSAASTGHVVFVGDVRLGAAYQFTQNWAVRGGYQLLWLDGIALASRQVPVSDPAVTGTATVDAGGSPFYNGAFVQLEYRR